MLTISKKGYLWFHSDENLIILVKQKVQEELKQLTTNLNVGLFVVYLTKLFQIR